MPRIPPVVCCAAATPARASITININATQKEKRVFDMETPHSVSVNFGFRWAEGLTTLSQSRWRNASRYVAGESFHDASPLTKNALKLARSLQVYNNIPRKCINQQIEPKRRREKD